MTTLRTRLARLTDAHGSGKPFPCLQIEESDGTRRPTDDELTERMARLEAEGFAPYVHRVVIVTVAPSARS